MKESGKLYDEYMELVADIILSPEIQRLEKEMRKAAQMLEYEYAAVLRDELIRLRGEK